MSTSPKSTSMLAVLLFGLLALQIDGGQAWAQAPQIVVHASASEFQPEIDFSGRINAIARHPNNPDMVIVSTPTGGLFRSTDGGNTWVPVPELGDSPDTSLPTLYTYDVVIHPADPDLVIATSRRDFHRFEVLPAAFAAAARRRELIERLGVVEEQLVAGEISPSIAFARTRSFIDELTISVSGGGIWISRDGGQNWSRPPTSIPLAARSFSKASICPPRYSAYAISIAPGANSIFVGTDCGVAVSNDMGFTWKHAELPGHDEGLPIVSVAALGIGEVLAGSKSGFWRSRDSGLSWSEVTDSGNAGDPMPSGVSGIHAIGDSPLAYTALVVAKNADLYKVDLYDETGGDAINWWKQSSPASGGGCGGIHFVRQYSGQDSSGERGDSMYTFLGNSCKAFLTRANLIENNPITGAPLAHPTFELEDDWITLEDNHIDARFILPQLSQGEAAGSGFLEPIVNDGGMLGRYPWALWQQHQSLLSKLVVSMIANDGGLDRYLGNSVTSVGSGVGKINALQLYQVTGGKTDSGALLYYIGTQDNKVRGSEDAGSTWPFAHSGEGFGLDAPSQVPAKINFQITYTGCSPCRTRQANWKLENPWATTGGPINWPDPFDDSKSDTGYPILIGSNRRASWGRDKNDPDDDSDDTIHLYRTNDSGASSVNWTKISDAIPSHIRDGVRIADRGTNQVDWLFGHRASTQKRPYYDGEFNSRAYEIGRIPGALTGNSITTQYLPRSGMSSIGRVPFQFSWYASFGLDSWNANALLAPDVGGQRMVHTSDLGMTWNPMTALTNAVLRSNQFYFNDADHTRREYFPIVSAIGFNPDDANLVLVGARQGGLYFSGDRGTTWTHVEGSSNATNITSIHWVSSNYALASSYGRGLWQIHLDTEVVWPEDDNVTRAALIGMCPPEAECSVATDKRRKVRSFSGPEFLGGEYGDQGVIVFGGSVSGVVANEGEPMRVYLKPGASALSFHSRDGGTYRDLGFKFPPAPEGSDIGGKLPGWIMQAGEDRNIIALALNGQQIQAAVFSDKKIDWPRTAPKQSPAPKNLPVESELHSAPNITATLDVFYRDDSRDDAAGSAQHLLQVTGENLEPANSYVLTASGPNDAISSEVKSDENGEFIHREEFGFELGLGAIAITLSHEGEAVAFDDVFVSSLDGVIAREDKL